MSEDKKKKFYVLEMFPYPSGDLHMGHLRNYVIGDVYTRYYKMLGYSVMHPMGWDAFGLPAENAAIQHKISPKEWTYNNISVSKETFKTMGIDYDWDREVATCRPDYYKWTQWLFVKLFEKGLAYKKDSPVNWCPQCNTVLANEQVINGSCYRCDAAVTKKDLEQWYFKITDYADRLLSDLDKLDKWPEKVKTMQKNWIGRSLGVTVRFRIEKSEEHIEVFTTRPDTLYGVTFMALAPEHPLIQKMNIAPDIKVKINDYAEKAKLKTELERGQMTEKEGIFTGIKAIHPLNGDPVDIYVADYVLLSYGTGAVMGVPAHDQRDFEFAKRYGIEIKLVINNNEMTLNSQDLEKAYEDEGIMMNSDLFNSMGTEKAREKIADHIENKGLGKRTVNYRLRDWLISRQRYWGTPIPIIYCEKCGTIAEKAENLPVLLPDPDKVDYMPKGRSPLSSVEEFVNTSCPECGGPAMRDTDTMDTFVDSSWYFLRYTDSKNEEKIFSKEKADFWMPVDLYIGGIEHAILHLLFSRFIMKFLHDEGYIGFDEPFEQLFTQGMVMAKIGDHWEVMSKSKGNAVPVGPFVEKEGSDVARATILFIAPPERELEWSETGVDGIRKFVKRVESIFEQFKTGENDDSELKYQINNLVKRVKDDIERFHINTAIAAMMEYTNFILKKDNAIYAIPEHIKYDIVKTMAPFLPVTAEKIWKKLGKKNIFSEKFPEYDEKALIKDKIDIPIQINGKLRDTVEIDKDTTQSDLEKMIIDIPKIKKYIEGKTIRKVVYVPQKIINIII